MAKVFVPQSSCIFAVIIFLLLILSVGLLVFVLKGQLHHENSVSTSQIGHVQDSPSAGISTHTPSPQTAPKAVPTKSTDNLLDSAHTTESLPAEDSPWENFRLPKYIVPVHYDLLLHPDLRNDTFSGIVNITVNVTAATQYFVVHAYRLTVRDSKVFDEGGGQVEWRRSFLYDPHEYFVLELEHWAKPGAYKLSFTFGGSLIGSIIGFYKSRYVDSRNETRFLATSKFQPTYARRAFPCFDEPSFKSTFSVSLVHEAGFIALSNMPVKVTEPFDDSGLYVTKFEKSVPMVTYLACFIVSDFHYRRTITSAGKEFRVYSAPDQVNKTQYALQFGSRVLEYFENYFGIDFPLPKQDMVAIPDFVSGAMEHWGVITFRETNLLYDKANSSPLNKQRVSAVISHEMAHMWFGNLVTMEWWDDLWLNEGFASYVEYKGVHEQHPEWDMLSQFVTEDMQHVMDLDSTMSSHPIVQPVNHPDEITEIFDDISYGKGASILRMLEFFVGKDNFRKGISQFLKKYKYSNAKTADLWEELSKACGYQGNHSISSVMKTWTEQMGFPYVTVRRTHKTHQNATVFLAKQKRFVKNQALYLQQTNNSTREQIWSVPLSYITASGRTDIVWIHDGQETEFTVPVEDSEWIKFNVNQTGFYLVNYEEEEWDRLVNVMMTDHEVLTPSDRSNLLFDAFLLAEAGHIPFDVFLSMSAYLKNETHLIPWETAYASFVYLCQLLEFTDVNFLLKSYVKDLTDALYRKLRWKPADNHLDNLLSTTIIGLACHSGNQECLTDASELFQNWTQGKEIPSTLRSLVYHYGMAEIGQEEHWNYMWEKYLAEESPPERKTLLYGLAHVRVPYLIHRYLEYAMDDTKIRRQDFFSILNYIAGNPVGRPFVWTFIRDKWPDLVEKFTLNDRYLGLAVKKVCSYFTSENELQQMRAFFAKFPDAGAGKRRRQQALENVQNNIKWLKTYKESVKQWLEVEGTAPWYYHRLPAHVVPEHYDLTIHPDLQNDVFTGTVVITVMVRKPCECFLIHAVNLNVTQSEVTLADDGSSVPLEDVFQYKENDYLVLKASSKLPVGKYKLFFQFDGVLQVSLKGLYKSSYVDPATQETRYLAATQFEAIEARRAFPCFDEPMFKTAFNVSVIHHSSQYALSNAMVESQTELGNGLVKTRFEKSFPMVTYLLCLIVCDFEYVETFTENGVRLRVYTAAHHIDKTSYSLELGSKILTYYENYFAIPFPLKKLDMIAIPDFGGHGMENWGLITYSEDSLLCENSSSIAAKLQIASIVAHELAHMWFGDLVTMKWWDDLWLNEGFATYISQKGVKMVEPEFDKENDEATYSLCRAMMNDQTVNSHPIVQQVTRVTSDIFDSIAYSKGSAVLGMLENYMGEDFRKGVSTYLKKYSFGNAKTEDLWVELTLASSEGLNVTSIMETWTRQMNYPYLTLERNPDAERGYFVQQRRFLEDPATKIFSTALSPFNYVWQIPLSYRTAENGEPSYILLNSSGRVDLSLPKSEWIKFNVNFTGYYSVNYDKQDWGKFGEILEKNPTVLSPADRVNLLFDAFSLASAGHIEYGVALNLTRYLKKETYHATWSLAVDELSEIKHYFRNDCLTRLMVREYVKGLTKDLLREYTWNDTGDYLERKLRSVLISAACSNWNHECLISAGNHFNRWMNGDRLSSEIKNLVYVYGLRILNDEESWSYVWQRYLDESDPDEKKSLLFALTSIRNVTLLQRLVELSRNESLVRRHQYFSVLRNIAVNKKGFPLITLLIFSNWVDLGNNHDLHETENFVSSVFSRYDTEEDLEKVKDFYKKHKASPGADRARTLAIENILENIRWHQMHSEHVKAWMLENVYMPWKDFRLPRHITPIRYNIKLTPDIMQSTFDGEVEVQVNVTDVTDYLVIHELDLKITSTKLTHFVSGEVIQIDETFPFKKNNFWVVRFVDPIPGGVYLLKMKFSGKFTVYSNGITRYEYLHRETREKRYIVATKFEPTEARKVFPCFDEPSMKAKFKLIIVHDANYTALSNMPDEARNQLDGNLVETVFEESVMISTYLIFCCILSDYAYLEADYKGRKVRVYAPADRIDEAEHGLNMTVKSLKMLEEIFQVPYGLPKLDSVVIPSYSSTAMEHWGIITYSRRSFLVNQHMTAVEKMKYVDKVIVHEMAHQWFGNLVTMKWWNDVWLNEGTSTLFMNIQMNHFHPEAGELDMLHISEMMCGDSIQKCSPVVRNVSDPSQLFDIFDSISYDKGGAILKMIQYILKDDFLKGISNYLKKYAFSNAESQNLWVELSQASKMKDVNITEVMNTWTQQMGFPYVELKRNGSTLTATQRWFLQNKNDSEIELLAQDKSLSPYGFIWKIPLIYKNLATGYEHTLWLNERNATFQIYAMQEDVIKFNPRFVGVYVVKYDDYDWARLGKRLLMNHEDFNVTDRYNLLYDAFLLADTDRLVYDIPLELTKYLKKEKEALPWSLLRGLFHHFHRMLDGQSEAFRLWKEYIADLTMDLYDEYIWDISNYSSFKKWDTRHGQCSFTQSTDLDFIPTIVELACLSANPKCLNATYDELQLWMQGQNITSDLRFVLTTAIPHFGDDAIWEFLSNKLISPDTPDDQKDVLTEGLAAFTRAAQINKTIDFMMTETSISSKLVTSIFTELNRNPYALPHLWNYYTHFWKKLLLRMDDVTHSTDFCPKFKTRKYLDEFLQFLTKKQRTNKFPKDCIKTIQEIVEWSDKHEETILSWLRWNKPM